MKFIAIIVTASAMLWLGGLSPASAVRINDEPNAGWCNGEHVRNIQTDCGKKAAPVKPVAPASKKKGGKK